MSVLKERIAHLNSRRVKFPSQNCEIMKGRSEKLIQIYTGLQDKFMYPLCVKLYRKNKATAKYVEVYESCPERSLEADAFFSPHF